MSELEQYIASYFHVATGQLEEISGFFHEKQLQKGDYFLKTGRYCEELSFIKSGILRIYAESHDREVTQWISTPGSFVTDLSSFVFHTPARWTIRAITDVELYTISRKDYQALGKLIPQWHELEKLFIARCFTMLEDRIFGHLSQSAEERYRQLFDRDRTLLNTVPQNYLASMLGMTPETFSRIRAKIATGE